jgi:hypothetical protein
MATDMVEGPLNSNRLIKPAENSKGEKRLRSSEIERATFTAISE